MAWNRDLATSPHLSDGLALSMLARARELVVDPSQTDLAMPHGENAGELLARASSSWVRYPPVDDAGKTFPGARRAEL